MALRNYIMHNKKKTSAVAAALLVVIAAVIAIARLDVGTKADVFKKDSEGNLQSKSEINILEIVAEYGQQIIGYTVSGYEPITKEQIENYHGDIDVDDFRNATGYQLQKSGSGDGNCNYTVLGNSLENVFNQNVLGDSMEEGEIIVTVCQANEVTTDMINSADLIYLNSNNYNSNLFYYYDQIVNNGEKGVNPGETGAEYDDYQEIQVLKTEASVKMIQEAAGRDKMASSLTQKDFLLAGIESFKNYNLEAYISSIAALEKGALTASAYEDSVAAIDALVKSVNAAEKTNAVAFIKSSAGKQDMTAEQKTELINAFLKAELSNCLEANYEEYVNAVASNTTGYTNVNAIQTMITNQNTTQMRSAIERLIAFKNSDGGSEDLSSVENDIAKIAYSGLKSDLLSDYAIAFADESFHFTNVSKIATCNSDLKALVDRVNSEKKQGALTLIADAPANAESMALLQGNALFYFELAEIEGFNQYNVDNYIAALSELEDVNSLKGSELPEEESSEESATEEITEKETTEEETAETESAEPESENETSDESAESESESETSEESTDTETGDMESTEPEEVSAEEETTMEEETTAEEEEIVYDYDYDKIKEFIDRVNANSLYMAQNQSFDISWENAFALYNYAIVDEGGFMYDTELLTSGTIGDFTQDLETNTNNLYKILLLMRQLQPDYCMDSVLPNIDEYGVYNNGTVSAWYKYTFYQEGSTDYSRYREPNVVGQTYSETGIKGNEKNYVYKHIYSYTGEQFVGGALFIGESLSEFLTEGGVITPGARDLAGVSTGILSAEVDETDNFIFMDTGKSGLNWTTAYAYFWGDELSSPVLIKMTSHDSGRHQFRVQVPEGAEKVIFRPNGGDNWSGQTVDCTLGSNAYYINSSKSGGKYTVSTTVPAGYTMYFGNLTNSHDTGTVYYSGSLDLEFRSFNVGTAYYQMDDGKTKSIQPGQSIHIGDGLENNAVTRIKLWYSTYNGNMVTRNYTYQKQSYEYIATNVIQNAEVKYYNSANIGFTFSGISNVTYQIDSGTRKPLVSGDVISIGEGIAEGQKTTITVTYTFGTSFITRKYYLLKVSRDEVTVENNFLSLNTADNTSSLQRDALLEDSVNDMITNGNKGDVMRYIMGITLNQLQGTFHVLEIQPTAAVSVLDSYKGILKLADYLRVEVPEELTESNYNDIGFIDVTTMSVKEFNTRNEDLTAKYDLIYFGIESGYQVVYSYTNDGTTFYRTYYNDSSMNGLVYTGIGDEYSIQSFLKGTASEDYMLQSGSITDAQHQKEYDYWKENLTEQFRNNQNADWNLDFDSSGIWTLRNTTSTTRLMGNDITVKKMNELLEYVKAGYPILLPDEIYNCDSEMYIAYDGDSANAAQWRYVDVNSKMYHFITTIKTLGYNKTTGEFDGLDEEGNPIFRDGKTYANIVQETYAKYGRNPDNLSAAQKFNGGLSFAIKRNTQIAFTLLDCPQEYNKDVNGNEVTAGNLGTVIKTGSSDYSTYRFELQVDSDVTMEWLDDNYSYQIYVDKSGTGRFDEDTTIELDPKYIYNESEKKVILEGKWPGNMDGFVPWKIVAYNKYNPNNCFSYTGFSAFEIPAANKKTVYVLWVRAQNLTMNFAEMIKNYKNSITEYDIKLVTISYNTFSNDVWRAGEEQSEYNSSNTRLRVKSIMDVGGYPDGGTTITDEEKAENPEFNMIVFGYSDSYKGLDVASIEGHKNIEYFVNSGHSLFFSHDNASYLSTMNYYTNLSTGTPSMSSNWGRYNTAFLRDMLGMDAYGATYSGKCFDESSEEYLEYLANTRKYLREDLTQKDFRGIIENCVFHYTSGGNRLYSQNQNSSSPASITDWETTQRALRMNQGQISEYPYVIGEYLDTALTHAQYMNLNLEDDDITIWYTLSSNPEKPYTSGINGGNSKYYLYTEGDGSNNYYIYSKGNITYTGSGHRSGQTDAEKKLFINTVIAAIKAGNFAPEVTFPDAENNAKGENIVYRYVGTEDGVTISFKPIDYDAQKNSHAFTDCKIYIDIDEDGIYTEGTDILLDDGDVSHSKLANTATGAPISFVGTELENKVQYYFRISDETIAELEKDWRLSSIYDKPVIVQITDNGTDKDPEKKTTVSNSIWIVEAQLHNLN